MLTKLPLRQSFRFTDRSRRSEFCWIRSYRLILKTPLSTSVGRFWSRAYVTFTSRNISDTSLGSAFRNLYSIFFFYSFFLSLQVLCTWSERLDVSSFASEWLFPHSQPLVRTRSSTQGHPVEVALGWVAAVQLSVPLLTSLYLYPARAATRLVDPCSAQISGESATPYCHVLSNRSLRHAYVRSLFWFWHRRSLFMIFKAET